MARPFALIVVALAALGCGAGGAAGTDGGTDTAAGACPALAGEPCAREGQTCTRSDGCCACQINGACGPGPRWYCLGASTRPAECAATPPVAMSACAPARIRCGYCVDGAPLVLSCNRPMVSASDRWTEETLVAICR